MLLLKPKKDDKIIIDLRKSSPEEIRVVAEMLFTAAQVVALSPSPQVMIAKKKQPARA